MKMFLLSDNNDTAVGLRLGGVDGVVIHTKNEIIAELEKVSKDEEIGILLITGRLYELAKSEITDYINEHVRPVVLTIPDRHGVTGDSSGDVMASAFGIK